MSVIAELIQDASKSTTQGIFGVIGIFSFLGIIVVSALYRIKQLKDEDHH